MRIPKYKANCHTFPDLKGPKLNSKFPLEPLGTLYVVASVTIKVMGGPSDLWGGGGMVGQSIRKKFTHL